MDILSGHSRHNAATVRSNIKADETSVADKNEASDVDASGAEDMVQLSLLLPGLDAVTAPKLAVDTATINFPIAAKKTGIGNWREFTLNEAIVEIPQGILQLSNLNTTHPVANGIAQGGVSALAFLRAYQDLRGNSVEQKMEGASSLILGVAGTVSLFPGGFAAGASNYLMMGQGAIELSLGVRELHEELFNKEKPHWQEVVTGSLDVIKGGSSFLPLFDPTANAMSNAIQLGALVAKTVLETTFNHDPEKNKKKNPLL